MSPPAHPSLTLLRDRMSNGDGKFVICGNNFFITSCISVASKLYKDVMSTESTILLLVMVLVLVPVLDWLLSTHGSSRGSQSRSCPQHRCRSSVPRRWLCSDTAPPACCSWRSATLGDCTCMLPVGKKIKPGLVKKKQRGVTVLINLQFLHLRTGREELDDLSSGIH